MSKRRAIMALVAKDLTLVTRHRFFAFISVLGFVAYSALYFVMPAAVDESIALGLYAPAPPEALVELLQDEGEGLVRFSSDEALRQAVLDQEISAGIALPADMVAQIDAGRRPVVQVYLRSDASPDLQGMMVVLVESLALMATGDLPNVQGEEVTLGPDMAGMQIPPRNRMLPLLAIVVLTTETMALASLMADEVQAGTLRALLVTPLGIPELFVAKGITGVGMAFAQAALLTLVIGGLCHQPLIILSALLLGALLVTGLGFLMASVGKDMLSVIGWGMIAMVLLVVPTIGIIFPGTVTGWAKIIPSHYLADTVHRVANLGAGWEQTWSNLLILLGADVVLFLLGVAAMKRKLA